jgi:hypothetical protein
MAFNSIYYLWLLMSEDGGVRITRADRLHIRKDIPLERRRKLKIFGGRISDWVSPPTEFVDEPVIICLKKGDVESCYDHFAGNVRVFEDLVEHKRRQGYSVSVKDAVLAYMLVWKRGSRHLIAGFLSTFPEWKDVTPETVGQALSRLKSEGWLR